MLKQPAGAHFKSFELTHACASLLGKRGWSDPLVTSQIFSPENFTVDLLIMQTSVLAIKESSLGMLLVCLRIFGIGAQLNIGLHSSAQFITKSESQFERGFHIGGRN